MIAIPLFPPEIGPVQIFSCKLKMNPLEEEIPFRNSNVQLP